MPDMLINGTDGHDVIELKDDSVVRGGIGNDTYVVNLKFSPTFFAKIYEVETDTSTNILVVSLERPLIPQSGLNYVKNIDKETGQVMLELQIVGSKLPEYPVRIGFPEGHIQSIVVHYKQHAGNGVGLVTRSVTFDWDREKKTFPGLASALIDYKH